MRIDRRKIKRRDKQILVGHGNKHRSIHGWVTLVCRDIGLQGLPGARARHLQRRVRDIQLRRPKHPLWIAGLRARRVAVVRADSVAGHLPGKMDFPAGPGERGGAVMRDGGSARLSNILGLGARFLIGRQHLLAEGVHARRDGLVPGVLGTAVNKGWVRLVEDREGREVLPRETGLILRAR